MKNRIKIAIFSGTIPSTTFIENLIFQVAKSHQVLLFGTLKENIKYANPNIKVLNTPSNQYRNIVVTLRRTVLLFFKNPKLVFIAFKEAKLYTGIYRKWMRFSRFVPVLLYQPDIFHLQWANEINRWVFLKQAIGCKIIVSLLGTLINISPKVKLSLKNMYLAHFHQVDAFHSVSEALAKDVLDYNVSPDIVSVIHTPIKMETFNYFSLPVEQQSDGLKIVSVGRYHWVKGYCYALDAIKLLCDKGVSVEYTIIAPNSPSEELLFLVQDLGLEKHVKFISAMPQQNLLKSLKNFDVMLLPSVSEGIANVVVEAMAIGLPVIATHCGGMSELLENNYNGWLVPIRNSAAIAESLKDFYRLPYEDRICIVNNAHNAVQNRFHEDMVGNQFRHFYENTLKL